MSSVIGFGGCRMEEWHHLCQNNANIPALTYVLKTLPGSENRIKNTKNKNQTLEDQRHVQLQVCSCTVEPDFSLNVLGFSVLGK